MDLTDKLSKLDSLKGSIDAQRPISADQERRVLQKFRLDWNYHSNAIEGNSLSIGETAALLSYGLTAKGKPLKDHLDISGHDSVLDILMDLVRNAEPMTEHTVRALHEVLLGGTRDIATVDQAGAKTVRTISSGKYKTAPNHVQTESGVIRFFASPTETPSMMADLLGWYKQELTEKTMHPVIFAATFHHRFVSIHPFDDGNGRMARILMNLILMQAGYLPAIFKIEDRNPYISALVQADQGEFAALRDLLADASINSAELFLTAINGGQVDDLGDFDKQLALLSQSVLSEQSGAGTPRTDLETLSVVESLLIPTFQSIEPRLRLIDKLFSMVSNQYSVTFTSGNSILDADLFKFAATLPMATSGKTIARSQLFYHAQGFVKNGTKSFLVAVSCNFGPHDFAIIRSGTNMQEKEIFRASYQDKFTRLEAEQIAKLVLADIVPVISALTIDP